MFDIGWTELLVIAVVAIIVVGPKDLPQMLRTLGRYAGKLKRTAGEFRSQFDDALRESEFDDIRNSMRDMTDMKPLDDIKDGVNQGLDPLRTTADSIKKGVEESTPTGGAGRMNTDPAPSSSKSKATSRPAPESGKDGTEVVEPEPAATEKTAPATAAAANGKAGSGPAPKAGD
jgi:sec-independent protein translocase protein TatB